jgi:hypothetical protein
MKNPLFPKKAPSSRLLPAMPVLIQYLGFDQHAKVKVIKKGSEIILKQSFPKDVPRESQEDHEERLRDLSPHLRELNKKLHPYELLPDYRRADSYALREAFFNINSIESAVEFLECCGPFRKDVHETSMSHIAGWQEEFRNWWVYGYNRFPLLPVIELGDVENERIGGLLSWEIHTDSTRLDSRLETVEAWVHCDSAVEAIGATIALDLISRATFKTCLWCMKVFEVAKENGRKFCTPECAHRAGQKRRRAEAKAFRERTAQKQPRANKTKGKV